MLRFTSVMKLAKRFMFVSVASIAFCTAGSVHAFSEGKPGGDWPKSWPKELEPLREQAWTWVHGFGGMSFHIPFADRKVFESVWPHILKLKSKRASVTLLSGSHILALPKGKTAGVIIRLPLKNVATGPWSVTRIELVVDGDIVDLNRIMSLPPDTPIIDKRVKKKSAAATKPATEKKSLNRSGG